MNIFSNHLLGAFSVPVPGVQGGRRWQSDQKGLETGKAVLLRPMGSAVQAGEAIVRREGSARAVGPLNALEFADRSAAW